MADKKLRAGILIVSDTAFRDPSTDKAGDALRETFASEGGDKWDAPLVKIVPDDVLDIQRTISQWADGDGFLNLIVTTGGTGFAVKDNTPEVCCPRVEGDIAVSTLLLDDIELLSLRSSSAL